VVCICCLLQSVKLQAWAQAATLALYADITQLAINRKLVPAVRFSCLNCCFRSETDAQLLLFLLCLLCSPPAALSSALPADAKKPLGVDILGSRITLFRDENGKVSIKEQSKCDSASRSTSRYCSLQVVSCC
jgi:hypothetical protein